MGLVATCSKEIVQKRVWADGRAGKFGGTSHSGICRILKQEDLLGPPNLGHNGGSMVKNNTHHFHSKTASTQRQNIIYRIMSIGLMM